MRYIDISKFEKSEEVLEGTCWFLVLKSQDQIERRRRLINSRAGGRFGRINPRPTATGLLVFGRLENSEFQVKWKREFREPRHIQQLKDGVYLLTEVDRVLKLNSAGEVKDFYTHPFFGFLHTIEISSDGARALIVSAGYDAVFELNLQSKKETFRWFAWDHGFNPDEEGFWLSAERATYERYLSQGKNALIIDPAQYGEQGLVTARRSVHPNAAVYNPFDGERSFIVSIGHAGELYRVSISDGQPRLVCDFFGQMPHGIKPFGNGWIVTDTTRGKWWIMNASFKPEVCYSLTGLGGKTAGTEEVEWLQQVIPLGESRALLLDANRGLIALDLTQKIYTIYQPEPAWCIQDALCLSLIN